MTAVQLHLTSLNWSEIGKGPFFPILGSALGICPLDASDVPEPGTGKKHRRHHANKKKGNGKENPFLMMTPTINSVFGSEEQNQ